MVTIPESEIPFNLCETCMFSKDSLPSTCPAAELLDKLPPGISPTSLKCQDCDSYQNKN